jgi:TfoX N-terminal domain
VAYDEDLANRIRELIASEPDVSEQTMFGGLVFLVGGRMSVAAGGQGSLVVRVDPEDTDVLLAKPHAHPFEMGGREMPGGVPFVQDFASNYTLRDGLVVEGHLFVSWARARTRPAATLLRPRPVRAASAALRR